MNEVTLITCTGMRPISLIRCGFFVSRFLTGSETIMQWIVVDDGEKESSIPVQESPRLSIDRIRPMHRWRYGMNTLAANLLAAIPRVRYDRILFLEDDDYYASGYLAFQMKMLDSVMIAGESHARYYHFPSRRYRILENTRHASLCQTGIRSECLPVLKLICEENSCSEFIDIRLWNKCTSGVMPRPGLLMRGQYVIGMKGLPGRPGIGMGHTPTDSTYWNQDRDLSVLRSWIGDDVSLYQ